jgi:hypothetical protein
VFLSEVLGQSNLDLLVKVGRLAAHERERERKRERKREGKKEKAKEA